MPTNRLPYFLGCPIWACADWCGELFTKRARRTEWLPQYSQVFNTVEGNSTFYGLPTTETVRRWAEDSHTGFQYCLKFPRTITHDARLQAAENETAAFLDVLSILQEAGKLGPSFLQLPPEFSPQQFPLLEAYLRKLPPQFPYAVEVRHQDFFEEEHEHRLNTLLTHLKMDRVIFDSRPLFALPPSDEHERVSQGRKPKLPVRHFVSGERPFLRIVGRNDLSQTHDYVREWAPLLAGWIRSGLRPYVFAHAPNDYFAPQFAEIIHAAIAEQLPELAALSEWPGRQEIHITQKSLF